MTRKSDLKKTWIRVCQECGYRLHTTPPDKGKELPSSFTEKKCPRCKSPGSFDYGQGEYRYDP